jgi:hypothetical protein
MRNAQQFAPGNFAPTIQAGKRTTRHFASEYMVTAHVAVAPSDNNGSIAYSEKLDPHGLAFIARAPPISKEGRRRNHVHAFNLASMNLGWLAKWCSEAGALLDFMRANRDNNPIFSRLLDETEDFWLYFYREIEQQPTSDNVKNATGGMNDRQCLALYYATAVGITRRITFFGTIYNQPNHLHMADKRYGSMSADGQSTMITTVQAGSFDVYNFWGPEAIIGRWLWIVLAVPDDDNDNNDPALAYRRSLLPRGNRYKQFKFIPRVSEDLQADLSAKHRTFPSFVTNGRLREIAAARLVGHVVGTKRAPPTQEAADRCAGLVDSMSIDEAFKETQLLQMLTVETHPKKFGSYVIWA